ncbi:MAG: hypothetical protein IKH45_05940 [Neisseriaceae bacterium]|nr:hypothetical protein [Neisseriaceae bacterium]
MSDKENGTVSNEIMEQIEKLRELHVKELKLYNDGRIEFISFSDNTSNMTLSSVEQKRTRRNAKNTEELTKQVKELRAEGKTYQEISDMYNISKPYVGKLLAKNNSK